MSPKAFSEKERELVRQRLMDAADRFLSTTGIRKTSVEELARAAQISKGAFYLFYDSKELLFLDALEREQERLHGSILRSVSASQSMRDGFVAAVMRMYRDFAAKPWLMALAGEDYEMLLRRVPQERIERHIAMDDEATRGLQLLFGEGLTAEPAVVSAVLRMLFLGLLHRREVGEELADKAFEFMIEAVADRIFRGENQ